MVATTPNRGSIISPNLLRFCAYQEGRLYEVECWLTEEKPLATLEAIVRCRRLESGLVSSH